MDHKEIAIRVTELSFGLEPDSSQVTKMLHRDCNTTPLRWDRLR